MITKQHRKGFDDSSKRRYNPQAWASDHGHRSFPSVLIIWRIVVITVVHISLVIISVALILSVIMQSKGAGLGGLTGADTGGIFTARRGVEKTLFYVTIVLSVIFFILAILSVKLA